MKNRMLPFAIMYLLIICFSVSGEIPVIELETKEIMELRSIGTFNYIYKDENIYMTNPRGTVCIDINGMKTYSYFGKEKELMGVLGIYDDGRLIINRLKDDKSREKDGFADIYFYDTITGEAELIPGILGGSGYKRTSRLFPKHGNIFYGNRANYSEGELYFTSFMFDASTGEEVSIDSGRLMDVSPDRMLGVLEYEDGPKTKEFRIINLETEEIIGRFDVADGGISKIPFFLDNEYIGHQYENNLDVVTIKGEKIISFQYLPPDGNVEDYKLESMRVRIPNTKYVIWSKYTGGYALFEVEDELKHLEELGLLYHPTTAILNDDRVRMREWPLLDAKHLAFLEEGEEVEVLDRSGIKVKIGDMEDYWYKIKRSDGQTGWSYGYFLDLAEAE